MAARSVETHPLLKGAATEGRPYSLIRIVPTLLVRLCAISFTWHVFGGNVVNDTVGIREINGDRRGSFTNELAGSSQKTEVAFSTEKV